MTFDSPFNFYYIVFLAVCQEEEHRGTQRQPEAHTPEDAAGTQRPPPGRDGSSEGEKPTGNTTTGSPAATAARTASSEPRDDGEDTKATSPAPGPDAATNRTKASDRRRSRPTSDGHRPETRKDAKEDPNPEQGGHEQRPPAHQDTDAPEAAARDTNPKAEQRQKPSPEGPPTAKTASRAPAARAAERAKASAPEAQPTATPTPIPTCSAPRKLDTLQTDI